MNTKMLSELFGGAERYKALKCLFANPGRDFGVRELVGEHKSPPAMLRSGCGAGWMPVCWMR
jgi:hypothetical protein